MANKMYREVSKGGKGTSPKYTMKGKDSKFDKSGMMKYTQNSKGVDKGKGMGYELSGGNEKFTGKYNQG